MTSRVIQSEQPCPKCPSSDAFFVYDDGHGYCFSCKTHINNYIETDYMNSKNNKEEFTYQYVPLRGISKGTMKKFNVLTKVNLEGTPIAISFPYSFNSSKAAKIRLLDSKEFYYQGEAKDVSLFGMDKFSPGQGMAVTVTEGEFDALAAYQMLGSKYPVVSVRSSTFAKKDCEKARKFLNSFDKIYLCFDNDKPGQDALREVSSLFDPNKVFHVKLGEFKDANDYLKAGKEKEFKSCWFNAKKYMPKDIISAWDDVERLLKEDKNNAIATYPFATMQEMTYGVRTGEVVLLTAQEKVGKTETLRAIEHHLLKTTDYNMGIIHLEEGERRAIQGLVGCELQTPVHLPDAGVSVEDITKTYKQLTKTDNRLHFYSHFGSDDPDIILDTIRYMASACNCKFISFDHITMTVTGHEDDDERKKLDYLSTRLSMMVRELDFTLFLVSHVNDDGKTRGSRNISKVADILLHMERDIESPNEKERNQTRLLIRGNRFAGRTGPAGVLEFNPQTFTLKEIEEVVADAAIL